LLPHRLEHRIDHGERDRHFLGNFATGRLAAGVDRSHCQIEEERQVETQIFPASGHAGDVVVALGRSGFLVRGRRVADKRDAFEVAVPDALRVREQLIVVELVQPKVVDRFLVAEFLGLGKPVEHGRGDGVLHAVDIHVVQVLPGTDVTVRGVVRHLEHLLVKLLRDDEPHGRTPVVSQ
jgi:hypothetical protein